MILDEYQYLYDVIRVIKQMIESPNVYAQPINTINIELIGSRLSAKTMQILKFINEIGYIPDLKIKTDIWRYDVAGAKETYEELIGVAEDIYNIKCNQRNSNLTNRTLKLPSNKIKVSGLMSNRKSKTPKLGKARVGANKQVQVNVFEEATEFNSAKEIQMMQQATGGGIIVINIFIANPWVLSNWYVKQFNRKLPFNEKKLRKHGKQYKSWYDAKTSTLHINHITNHRINTYLSDAQHQMLYDAWNISEQFARVVDLGLPGVAEGLIYAPVIHMVGETVRTMPIEVFKAGIDWGTSTSAGGSATTLVLGRVGKDYSQLAIDEVYYHSNSKQTYKDDATLIKELVETLLRYVDKNQHLIRETRTGRIEVAYDYGSATLGHSLKKELALYTRERPLVDLIFIVPCVKFEVPTRIDIVKTLITQGRYKVNRERCAMHMEELETAQWEETKLVSGRPTRLNEDDHTLDATEYLIGSDLLKFASAQYLEMNKVLNRNFSRGH